MSDRSSPAVRLEMLGPPQAWLGDSRLVLGPVQQRVVRAVLALHANRPVGREQLIDAVWGQAPPTYVVNLVQKYVSGLRRALEPVRAAGAPSRVLTWTDAGYLLAVPAGGLDLEVFDRELARARAARAREGRKAAAQALHGALGLWRGPAFDGLTSPLLDAERERLAERRIDALEDRIDLDLTLGEGHEALSELRQLVADHPLRERLRGLLMRALWQAGRQADALAEFRHAQRHLASELGVEPSAELQALHQRMLAGDEGLTPAPVRAVAARPPQPPETQSLPTPAQLPHGLADFAGRAVELDRLNELLPDESADTEPAVTIAAITGTAGVGKTSLAVHWAHQLKHRYPDGQLYVNLRGFDQSGTAMDPAEAVRGFLDAFGVSPQRVPASLEAQAALYRSLLDGRRVLVVLDNARETGQVTSLLPGAPGCLVVVTSRNRLSGLLAVGAVPVTVGLLTRAEARQLLGRRIGQRRIDAEPDAVDDIIAVCARLPLALAIVGARAACHPQFTLAELAEELCEESGGLDVFVGDSEASDARAVLSWSYRALSERAARLFRLLGLHPGADFSTAAAASLAGLPLAQARRLLAELSSAHLIEEGRPGRFAFHDLLHAYAAEQCEALDSEPDRHLARGRMLDHYLHTARAADRLLYSYRVQAEVDPPSPGVAITGLTDAEQALAWLTTESPVLLAAIEQAAAQGFHTHVARLCWTLSAFLNYQGHWYDWAASLRAALAACRHLGDRAGQALAHRLLNIAYQHQDRLEKARVAAHESLALFAELGDHAGEARIHLDLGRMLEGQGCFQESLGHAREALELYRAAGDKVGEADALNAVGRYHSRLGYHEQALSYCYRSLELHDEQGAWPGLQADTWHSIGYAHHQLGRHDLASTCYERALSLWEDLGDRYEIAALLVRLGDNHRAAGDRDAAQGFWAGALSIFDELGRPEARELELRMSQDRGADRAEIA